MRSKHEFLNSWPSKQELALMLYVLGIAWPLLCQCFEHSPNANFPSKQSSAHSCERPQRFRYSEVKPFLEPSQNARNISKTKSNCWLSPTFSRSMINIASHNDKKTTWRDSLLTSRRETQLHISQVCNVWSLKIWSASRISRQCMRISSFSAEDSAHFDATTWAQRCNSTVDVWKNAAPG